MAPWISGLRLKQEPASTFTFHSEYTTLITFHEPNLKGRFVA
jgi:hypothetical protein